MDDHHIRNLIKEIVNVLVIHIREEIEMELRRPPRLWVGKWIARRENLGASFRLLQEVAHEDPAEYFGALRMTEDSFNELLYLVTPVIQKSDTFMRCALPANVKLHAILYMLATGCSLRTVQHLFRVAKTTLSAILCETCDAIYDALKGYIQVPNNHEEWKNIERGFRNSWNFPGCCGAIDGKHVLIKAPIEAGSYYFNYKKQNSIVLMAVVDHDYCFTYIDIGCNGRVSDGGVFSHCSLSHALENNLLPEGYLFVGDNAFPLKKYLMKPYGGNNFTHEQKIFNYRLSRARRIVENAFGILVARFRIFEKPIPFEPSKVEKIVKACCAIHNWARKTKIPIHVAGVDNEDTERGIILNGEWRNVPSDGIVCIQWRTQNRSSQTAQNIRNSYAAYFIGEGAVSWQERMIY